MAIELSLGAAVAFVAWLLNARFQRSQISSPTHLLVAAAVTVSATLVFSLGPLLQALAWTVLHEGPAFEIRIRLRDPIWSLLRDVLRFGAIPGAVTAAAIASAGNPRERFARGSAAAIISLTANDSMVFAVDRGVEPNWNWVFFSLFSNLVGGPIGAVISLGLNDLIRRSVLPVPSPATSPGLVTRLWPVVSGVVAIALGMYFIFIYRFPSNLTAAIEEWTELAFTVEPQSSASAELMISTKTLSADAKAGVTAQWQFGPAGREEKSVTATAVRIGTVAAEASLDAVKAFREDRRSPRKEIDEIYRGAVDAGEIRVDGDHLRVLLVDDSKEKRDVAVTLPPEKRVIFKKTTRAFWSARGSLEEEKRLDIRAEGADLGLDIAWHGRLVLGIAPRWTSPAPEGFVAKPFVIRIPKRDVIIAPLEAASKESTPKYPLVLLAIRRQDRPRWMAIQGELESITAEGEDVVIRWQGGEEQPRMVRDVGIRGAKGTLRLADEKYTLEVSQLTTRGRFYLRDRPTGIVLVEGFTSAARLNGALLSKSLWGSLSPTVQGAVIGAALGSFGSWLLWRSRRGGAPRADEKE